MQYCQRDVFLVDAFLYIKESTKVRDQSRQYQLQDTDITWLVQKLFTLSSPPEIA